MDVGQIRGVAGRVSFRFSRAGSVPIPGVNPTNLRGQGLGFVGYREYQYGDDIRSVDWNVAARQGHPVVKLFEQEQASALVLVLDASGSMRVPDGTKWDVVRELAVLFAFVAARESELVAAVAVTSEVDAVFPLRRGTAHANALARWLDALPPGNRGTGLAKGIERAARMLKRPGVVVVASDFLVQDWDHAVWSAASRHAVVGLRLVSPREQELRDVGLIQVHDVESRRSGWVDTHDAGVRRAYAAAAERTRLSIRARLRDAGAMPVDIQTGRPCLPQLFGICRVRAR